MAWLTMIKMEFRPVFCNVCTIQTVNHKLSNCDEPTDTAKAVCCDLSEFTEGVCHRRGCTAKRIELDKCGGPHGRMYQALHMSGMVATQSRDTVTGPCDSAADSLDKTGGTAAHNYRRPEHP